MLVEIRKAGFVNKGAELMLHAVLAKMKTAFPTARFAMAPLNTAPFYQRAKLGLYQKGHMWRKGFHLGELARLLPEKTRRRYGIVLNREVDVVLDAAGFAYSDQWRLSCLELAYFSRVWKKNRTKAVLLPQAFGPYEKPENRSAMKRVLENVDLVFARDRVSYEHLVDIAGKDPKLQQAPDFTNLVEGVKLESDLARKDCYCIVPNYRMIDKSTKFTKDAYVPFMVGVARYIQRKGERLFILVHEGPDDLTIAKQISDLVEDSIEVVKESNPLRIKGILGQCRGVIASRYHALVSALSQGVPALGTGWSHKYNTLFEDYHFAEGLLDVEKSEENLYEKLDMLIEQDCRRRIGERLRQSAESLKEESEKMWEVVFAVVSANGAGDSR